MLKKALFGFFYPGYQAENHTDIRQPFLSDTECNTNLSGRGLRKWEVLDVVSGAAISTQALIAAAVLFLEALRSRDPKVLICCLLGQCWGSWAWHGASAACSCSASPVLQTGAPGSSALM